METHFILHDLSTNPRLFQDIEYLSNYAARRSQRMFLKTEPTSPYEKLNIDSFLINYGKIVNINEDSILIL